MRDNFMKKLIFRTTIAILFQTIPCSFATESADIKAAIEKCTSWIMLQIDEKNGHFGHGSDETERVTIVSLCIKALYDNPGFSEDDKRKCERSVAFLLSIADENGTIREPKKIKSDCIPWLIQALSSLNIPENAGM